MNILSIDFISMLMLSGLMFTLYGSSKTLYGARVFLTEKFRKNCCTYSGDLKTHLMQDDVPVVVHESNDTVSFLIDGMTGKYCINKKEDEKSIIIF